MTGTLPASGTTVSIATSGSVDASLVTGISVVVQKHSSSCSRFANPSGVYHRAPLVGREVMR